MTRGSGAYDSLTGTLVAKTGKAALIDYGTGEIWTPLSVMSEDSRDDVEAAAKGDNLDIEVAEWFIEKESLRG